MPLQLVKIGRPGPAVGLVSLYHFDAVKARFVLHDEVCSILVIAAVPWVITQPDLRAETAVFV